MMFSKIITTDDEKNKKLFIKFHSVRSQSGGGGDKGDGFMSNEKNSNFCFLWRCSFALPAGRAEFEGFESPWNDSSISMALCRVKSFSDAKDGIPNNSSSCVKFEL